MRIVFVRRRQITQSGLLLALFVLAFILALQAKGIERRLLGIKAGVMLESTLVEGLYPEELTRLIRQMQPRFEKQPQNAIYLPETGAIIPERTGLSVDVAATVRTVCKARPHARLKLQTRVVPAAVTKDFFAPIFQGSASRKEAALAINVAWGEEYFPALLDVCKKAGIHVTFFFEGNWAAKFPEMVQAASRAGHEIGNHGREHLLPRSLDDGALARLILENQALLGKIIGRQPPTLFAPPAGDFDNRTVGVAAKLGFRTILWTVDTIDWKRPSPDLITSRVVTKAGNGSIILMHPTEPTLAALPGIIAALQRQGLHLVTVSELLR